MAGAAGRGDGKSAGTIPPAVRRPAPAAQVPPRTATLAAAPGAPTEEHKPYIPASTVLPEMTIKVFVVGIILAWVMSSANAYLGLYAALTVSAAIPASVVSMAVLRFFRNRNILENNLIQTTASAGESVTAGIIFVLPALLFLSGAGLGYWDEIGIWETIVIAALGGSLGVLFTIPLRRAFIVEAKLQYPEGVATVEVLKSGEKGGTGVGFILTAGLVGAAYKFMQSGFGWWADLASWGRRFGSTGAVFATNLSPALLGVGFIVGLNIASLIFIGGLITYGIAIPVWLANNPWPVDGFGFDRDPFSAFTFLQRSPNGPILRYIGVGAMVTGGVWTLIRLRGALKRGFQSGLEAYRAVRGGGPDTRARTERDMSMRTVLITLALFTIPLMALFTYFVTDKFRNPEQIWVGMILGVVMMVLGFLFSAVAGYMAGVVGSSNNPISGTAIGTIFATAVLLSLLGVPDSAAAAATILIGSTIASAAAIAGDNMQDLKAGYLLGGTPKNLQIMQMVGAIAAAFSIPFVLLLLDKAYGIGGNQLPAPQAGIMASIVNGFFGTTSNIPWNFVLIGVGIAVAIIVLDLYLQSIKAKFRTPVLAVAVGMYLPLETSTPIFLGGLLAFAATLVLKRQFAAERPDEAVAKREQRVERRLSQGVLFSSGLIAGEALMGILVGGVLVVAGDKTASGTAFTPFAFFEEPTWFIGGFALLAYIGYLLYYSAVRRPRATSTEDS